LDREPSGSQGFEASLKSLAGNSEALILRSRPRVRPAAGARINSAASRRMAEAEIAGFAILRDAPPALLRMRI